MTASIQLLNTFAAVWFHFFTRASLEAAVALTLAFLLAAASRSGRIKSWWWRLAHLKLLLVLLCITPLALPLLPAQHPTPQSPPSATVEGGRGNVQPSTPSPLPTERRPPPRAARANVLSQPDPSPAQTTAHLSLESLLLSLWLLGLTLSAAHLAYAFRRTQALRRRALPIKDPKLLELAHRAARTLHVQTTPTLLTSTEISTPLVTGTLHPAILLPAPLLETTSSHSLELILTHELAHLARRDLWWNWLSALLSLPFFFHPFLWLARREWHAAQEIACDQLTLSATNSAPADYARTLLAVITHKSRPGLFAAGMGTFTTTKRRMNAMTHQPSKPTLTLTLIALVAVLGLTPWRLVAQSSASSATGGSSSSGSTPSPLPAASAAPDPFSHNPQPPAAASSDSASYHAIVNARSVALSPAVDGTVRTLDVVDGQHVKSGTLLLALDSRDQQIAVRLAELDLKSAKKTLDRFSSVPEGSSYEKDQVEVAEQRAEIALEKAKSDLDKTFIRAPIDGIVRAADVAPGEFVAKGAPVLTIIDTSKYVSVVVAADDVRFLHVGQSLSLSGSNRELKAEVTFISPEIESATATCLVKAVLKSGGEDFRTGQFVTVSFPRG